MADVIPPQAAPSIRTLFHDDEGQGMLMIEKLKTPFETELYICPETSQLAHDVPDAPQFRETVLLRSKTLPTFGILSRLKLLRRPTDRPITSRVLQRNFLPVTVQPCAGRQHVVLRDCASGRAYQCRADLEILYETEAENGAEVMMCEPCGVTLLPAFEDCAKMWSTLFAARGDPMRFLEALGAFAPDLMHETLAIAIDLVSSAHREAFLSYFLADEGALLPTLRQSRKAICEALPSAEWLPDMLRCLGAWSRDRSVATPRVTGPALDFLGQDASWDRLSPHASSIRLLHALRAAIKPRHKLAVVACARDEGLYLLEWIAAHRALGVEQFFIYTNDLTDGSDVLLARLHEAGIIQWIDNTGEGRAGNNVQTKAYGHALSMLPALLDYAWCLTIDLDEWFLPSEDSGQDLSILLQRFGHDVDAVVATWRINGPDRALCWTDALSSDRFVTLEAHPLVKSVFRPHRFYRAAPHIPISYGAWRCFTIDGLPHDIHHGDIEAASFCEKRTVQAEVHHFNLRSFEEFVWRYARGENDGNAVLREKRFRYNDAGIFALFTQSFDATGPRRASLISARCQAELDQLKTLPGVRGAWARIVETFRAEVPRYVLQSLVAVEADMRVPQPVKEKWRELVEAWGDARNIDVARLTHVLSDGHPVS